MRTRPHLALLVSLVLASTPVAENGPQIRVIGDKSAGPAEGPSTDVMQELLNWGIQNSDPERIKELMEMYKEKNLTIKDVYGQDVIDALFVNEGSVMQDMIDQIADFANASVTDEDLEGALERLQELVEQVDNAGNLHRMGGLRPLLDLGLSIGSRSESVRASALWALGVAVQNNAPVQDDLLSLGGLSSLLGRLPSCRSQAAETLGSEYCGKLLFAISGLVRNNETIQKAADSQGLFEWLIDSGTYHHTPSIVKKSLGLLDIALSQSPDLAFLETLPAKHNAVADRLLVLVRGGTPVDTDNTEKALRLINRLVSLRPMLFRISFRSELSVAVTEATKSCENVHGVGDELCEGLSGLAKHTDLALSARELSDDEL